MTDAASLKGGPAGSVLVAGVGSVNGLGAAIARRFGREGFSVLIAGRNAEKLQATEAALLAEGLKVSGAVGDVSVADDVQRFVANAQKLAPLAVAVHNAGSNRPSPFLKLSEAEFEAHWREHALGGFQLAQAALPVLLARGEGSLFFTGASGSLRGKANFAPFAAAKAALRNLAQSLAREFGPQGIHVGHVVIDGGIEGERLLSRVPQLKDQRGPDGRLVRKGVVRADALGLGLEIDDGLQAIGAGGAPTPGLFAVGPLTRGAFWEAIAVPDLRVHTALVAAAVVQSLGLVQAA